MENKIDKYNAKDPDIGPNKETNDWVSVIVPTYNRARCITKSLDTVWAQTYRPIELLIVDDGSTDETKQVVCDWKKIHSEDLFITKYFYQKNRGAPSARNTGIRNAKGRYLQFLDSDDLLIPEKLFLQVALMKKEQTPICIADYLHVDETGKVINRLSKDFTIDQIIKGFIAVHTSPPLIERSFVQANKLKWNERLPKLQDKDFFMKVFMLVNYKSYINKPLFRWVHHSGSRITKTDERGHMYYERGIYARILISVVAFHIKHFRSISYKKRPSIIILYKRLILRIVK